MTPFAQVLDMELSDLIFALLGVGLGLVPSILSMPSFLSFGMGIFPLYNYRLEVLALSFTFQELTAKRVL